MKRTLVWLGGGALLAATAIDTLAVIGRQVGLPVEGSIEAIQVAVLAAGSLALLAATAARSHAQVHLVVDRLGEDARDIARRLCALALALFLLALLAGSGWIAADLWHAHEESELLGVPWRWLRLFANAALLTAALAALSQALRRRG